MKTYRFTVYIRGLEEFSDEQANAIYEAGCQDSSVCSGELRAMVHFDRESKSLETAIASAIEQLKAAGMEIDSVEIEQDAAESLIA